MKKNLLLFLAIFWVGTLFADAEVGKTAPNFKVKDQTGKEHTLATHTGHWLVLEWYNRECPFVKKHYGSGNMQKIQKAYTGKGVTWLSVISSAPGKQGHLTAAEATEDLKATGSGAQGILLDEDGAMGKAYGAKTTPHMFIIDPQGKVAYAGAIDDNDSANPAVIEKSKNYVAAALDLGLSKKAVQVSSSKPYGCSVKYK